MRVNNPPAFMPLRHFESQEAAGPFHFANSKIGWNKHLGALRKFLLPLARMVLSLQQLLTLRKPK